MRVLLENAVVTGPGESVWHPQAIVNHEVDCSIVDADTSVSAVVVDIESSMDPPEIPDIKAVWGRMARKTFTAGELTALFAKWAILNMPARRVRANLITITGADGSTDLFTVRYQTAGSEVIIK